MRTTPTTPPAALVRAATLLALAGLLAATGCSVGTDDDADGVEIDSGNASDNDEPTDQPGHDGADQDDEGEESETPEGALLLIMDASGSMNETDASGKRLIDSAKQALHAVVDDLPDGLHTGLRVFGHRHPNTDKTNGCRDSELIAPVEPLDRDALNDAIDGYQAKGFTPIGYSLQQAANDLPSEGPRTIILVSDGDDTCAPPDPCQIARDLRDDGVEVVVHTVGVTLGDNQTARDQLGCIAEATGGEFSDVADAGDLATTLGDVTARETRRFETAGLQLEGAPIPRDADTGDLDTPHVDTVVHGEVNYYRFEIDPGSEVEAEVYTAGNPNSDVLLCMHAVLVDKADASYGDSDGAGGNSAETQIDAIDPVVVDDGEVWLKLDVANCYGNGQGNPDVAFDVEFTVRQVD